MHRPTVFSLVSIPVIVFAYVLLARKEERQGGCKHPPSMERPDAEDKLGISNVVTNRACVIGAAA